MPGNAFSRAFQKPDAATARKECSFRPRAFQVLQQVQPAEMAFSLAVLDGQQLLVAVLGDADHDQHARAIFLQAHIEVDGVGPQVDVALAVQVALRPGLELLLPDAPPANAHTPDSSSLPVCAAPRSGVLRAPPSAPPGEGRPFLKHRFSQVHQPRWHFRRRDARLQPLQHVARRDLLRRS